MKIYIFKAVLKDTLSKKKYIVTRLYKGIKTIIKNYIFMSTNNNASKQELLYDYARGQCLSDDGAVR